MTTEAPVRIKATTAPAPGVAVAEGMQPRARNAKGQLLPRAQPQAPEADEDNIDLNNGVKRVPLGQHVAQLGYAKRPGFHRRWVSDLPGRIDRALAAGWTHVKNLKSKNPEVLIVDKSLGEKGRKGFLMEIPQALYDEDQKVKSDMLDEVDANIYNGVHNEQEGDKRYNPRFAPNKNDIRRGSGKV